MSEFGDCHEKKADAVNLDAEEEMLMEMDSELAQFLSTFGDYYMI